MKWIKKEYQKALLIIQSKKQRSLFTLIVGIIISILFWKNILSFPVSLGIISFTALGIFIPQVITPILVLWLFIGSILQLFISRILFSIIYFLIVFPLSFFIKRPKKGWTTPSKSDNENLY